MKSYNDLLPLLGGNDKNVRAVFRSGSRLYGCHEEWSDEDFVALLVAGKRDLIRRPRVNIIVQTAEQFQQGLREHSILALECFFTPPEARLKDGPIGEFKLNPAVLLDKATETSQTDFNKAVARWSDQPEASKKKLYHSIRILMFATQIAQRGRIDDYGAANGVWTAIRDNWSQDWADYTEFVELRERLLESLRTVK